MRSSRAAEPDNRSWGKRSRGTGGSSPGQRHRKCRIGPAPHDAGPPRNRTCQSPSIRLEQALEVRWREAVRSVQSGVDRPRVRSPRRWSRRLTCPSVRASSSSSPTGSPDRVGALSSRATRPVSGRLSATTSWRTRHLSRFPAAFRPPAIRFSAILFPPGSWALLTVGLPAHGAGPRRGYHVPHVRAATGVGALYTPETAVLIPDRGDSRPAPAALQRAVPAPRRTSHRPGFAYEASTRVQAIRRSRSSPRLWRPGWNGPPLGLPSRFAPRRPGAGRRTPRWGQAIEHGPGTTRSTSHQSISNPVVHSIRASSCRTSPLRSSPGRRSREESLRRGASGGSDERCHAKA